MTATAAKPSYLTQAHFNATLVLATVIHVAALVVWSIMPKPPVVSVPVRVLSLKLGESDGMMFEQEEALPQAVPSPESLLSYAFPKENEAAIASLDKIIAAPLEPEDAEDGLPSKADLETMATEFVRPTPHPAQKIASGSEDGAATGDALRRYEQMLSLWLQKHKLYPEEARRRQIQGEAVLRLRIDRRGNIKYFTLEKQTGTIALDRAVLDMVKRANPVPPVPDDYPAGALLEFLVPVIFTLE